MRIAVLTASSHQQRVPQNARRARLGPSRMAELRQRARRVRCAVPGPSVTAEMLSRHVVLTRNTALLGRTRVSRVVVDTSAAVAPRQHGRRAQLAQQGTHAAVAVPRQPAQLGISAGATVRRAHRAGPTKSTVRLLLPIAIDAPLDRLRVAAMPRPVRHARCVRRVLRVAHPGRCPRVRQGHMRTRAVARVCPAVLTTSLPMRARVYVQRARLAATRQAVEVTGRLARYARHARPGRIAPTGRLISRSAMRARSQLLGGMFALCAATTINMRLAKDPALVSCASWGPQLPAARRQRDLNVARAPQATSATVIVLPNSVPPAHTLRQDLTRAVDVEMTRNSVELPQVIALPARRGPSRQAMTKPPGRRARNASRGHRVMAPARSRCVLAASTSTAEQRSVRIAVLTASSHQQRVPQNARRARLGPSRMAELRQRARRVRCAVPGPSVTAEMLSRHVVLTRNTALLGRTRVSRVVVDTSAAVAPRQHGRRAQLAQQGTHAAVAVPRQPAQLGISAGATVRRAHRAGPTKSTVRLLLPIAIDAPLDRLRVAAMPRPVRHARCVRRVLRVAHPGRCPRVRQGHMRTRAVARVCPAVLTTSLPMRARVYVQRARLAATRQAVEVTGRLARYARHARPGRIAPTGRLISRSAMRARSQLLGGMFALCAATTINMRLVKDPAPVKRVRWAAKPSGVLLRQEPPARDATLDGRVMAAMSPLNVLRENSRRRGQAHAPCVETIRVTVPQEPTNVHRVRSDTSHPEMPTRCERRARSASPDRRATAQAA